MKLTWMGNYRNVVEAMVSMCNAYCQVNNSEVFGDDVKLSPTQLQLMGYIIESEELNQNMASIASRFSFSQSNFSKMIKALERKGLIEKYHTANNSKNIIIRASENGRKLYKAYTESEMAAMWKTIFDKLDTVDAKSIDIFVECMNDYTAMMRQDPKLEKALKRDVLIKI